MQGCSDAPAAARDGLRDGLDDGRRQQATAGPAVGAQTELTRCDPVMTTHHTRKQQPVGTTLYTFGEFMQHMAATGRMPSEDDLLRQLEQIVDWGFDALELPMDLHFAPGRPLGPLFLARLREATAEGLILTAHMPFLAISTTTHIERVREGSCQAILEAWHVIADLPVRSAVVHLSGALSMEAVPSDNPAARQFGDLAMSQARQTIEQLLPVIPASVLSVENLPDYDFHPLWPLVEEYNLGVCLDNGHAMLRGDDLWGLMAKVLPRTRQLHLHDVVEQADAYGNTSLVDHHELGSGILDLERFARTLGDRDVIVILEVANRYSPGSLETWKNMKQQLRGEEVPC